MQKIEIVNMLDKFGKILAKAMIYFVSADANLSFSTLKLPPLASHCYHDEHLLQHRPWSFYFSRDVIGPIYLAFIPSKLLPPPAARCLVTTLELRGCVRSRSSRLFFVKKNFFCRDRITSFHSSELSPKHLIMESGGVGGGWF